jgi:hypothetical protein
VPNGLHVSNSPGSRAHVGFEADKAVRKRLSWESSVYLSPHCSPTSAVCRITKLDWIPDVSLNVHTQWCRWIALRNFGIKLETLLGTTTYLYSVRLSISLSQLLCHFRKQWKLELWINIKKGRSICSCLLRICTGKSSYSWKPLHSSDDKFFTRSKVLFISIYLLRSLRYFLPLTEPKYCHPVHKFPSLEIILSDMNSLNSFIS